MNATNNNNKVSAEWTNKDTLDGIGDWPPSISPNDWPPSIQPSDWPPSDFPTVPKKVNPLSNGWICPKCGTPISPMQDVCPICVCNGRQTYVTTTGTGEFNLDIGPSSFCKK